MKEHNTTPPRARHGTALRLALLALLAAAAAVAAFLALTGGDPTAPAAGPEQRIRVARGLPYAPGAKTVLDVYRKRSRRPAPAVLVVHGGGWRYGDKRKMAPIARALARAGFVAFNANYTLATPGRPGYARQPRELRAAVRWIRRNSARLGVDRTRIGAIGSSAGAHLVGLLALDATGPLAAGSRVRAAVAWSGPFDLLLENPAIAEPVETMLGCAPQRCPRRAATASPIEHASADDPDMLIVHSKAEFLRVEHATALAASLAHVGVPYRLLLLAGARHGFDFADVALARSIAFLRRRLG